MSKLHMPSVLRRVKESQDMGGGFTAQKQQQLWSKISDELGFMPEQERSRSIMDYVEFFSFSTPQFVFRPMAIGLSLFTVVFGSWVATVNASFDSVPGDILYPVKLVTERVQLSFTTSNQQRVRLQTEFASRRLQEATNVAQSNVPDKPARLKTALDGFASALNSANDELQQVKQTTPSDVAEVAKAIGRKTDEYEAIIETSQKTQSTTDVQETVAQVKETVNHTNAQVVETLVQTHEEDKQEQTATELRDNFTKSYQNLQERQVRSLGRLSVIEQLLLTKEFPDEMSFHEQISTAKGTVLLQQSKMNSAMDVMAAGGYRKAFEDLRTIDVAHAQIEETIANLEIAITTASAEIE